MPLIFFVIAFTLRLHIIVNAAKDTQRVHKHRSRKCGTQDRHKEIEANPVLLFYLAIT